MNDALVHFYTYLGHKYRAVLIELLLRNLYQQLAHDATPVQSFNHSVTITIYRQKRSNIESQSIVSSSALRHL